MHVLSEQGLVACVAAGERDALGVLYERHVRSVFRFALVEMRSREDAEDITQETFLTLASRARAVVVPGDSVLPWLLVTCKNLCRNKQRAHTRETSRRSPLDLATEVPAGDSVEDAAERNALREAVRVAVDALSAVDRRVSELCIDGDASYQKAALALGVSHGSIRNRISRLRVRLRESLAPNQEVHQR